MTEAVSTVERETDGERGNRAVAVAAMSNSSSSSSCSSTTESHQKSHSVVEKVCQSGALEQLTGCAMMSPVHGEHKYFKDLKIEALGSFSRCL